MPTHAPLNEACPSVVVEESPRPEPLVPKEHTYGQILRSSVLIGGASVVNIGLGIVRTKALAIMIGPAGVGLFGLYSSIADLTQSIAGMGLNSSGVRQIAEAVGSGEPERIARTASVLGRIAALLGLLGAALLIAFSSAISTLTFGTSQRAHSVAMLGVAVFFTSVAASQAALVQGMRRISDLARMGMIGALFGTAISIPLVYFLRQDGVVPSLIGVAAMTVGTSLWFSRKVELPPASMSVLQVKNEAALLLKLGFAFMASGLLTLGSAYLIRILVVRYIGVEAAGLYQSAWGLGGLYVGFILQAMGADFYPRLTAAARDHDKCNRLVNEQAQISLLLAGPGVLATLTFAPIVIALFYSTRFDAAVGILRWICLGMTLRVISWPMGFILLAKGVQTIFFWTEVAATTLHIGLAWLCITHFGLTGAGAAFFGLYVGHGLLIYTIVRRLTGFRWSLENKRIGRVFLPVIGLTFCGFYVLPLSLATGIGAAASVASAAYSIRTLASLISMDQLPRPIRTILGWFRTVPFSVHG